MVSFVRLFAQLLLLLCTSLFAQQNQNLPVTLLKTGVSNTQGIVAKSGEEYYGLVMAGYSARIEKFALIVEPITNTNVSDTVNADGMEVSVEGEQHPVFLFRDLPGVSTGEVVSGRWGQGSPHFGEKMPVMWSDELRKDQFRADPKEFYFLLACGDVGITDQGEPKILKYGLYLLRHDKAQELVKLPFTDEHLPSVLWTGDLDRDGKPDLFGEFSGVYYKADYKLFLSSMAADGDYVGLAGQVIYNRD